jgi:hypothetical protein
MMNRLNLLGLIRATALCAGLTGCLGNVDESDEETDVTEASLSTGTNVTLVREGSGKCLDVAAAGTAVGTKIQQWVCNGTPAQTFVLESVGNNEYRLKNPNSGKCAAASGKGTANFTQIELADCGGGGAQKFRVEGTRGEFHKLVNTGSGRCLDVSGSSSDDGAKVQLYDCNGTGAQNWNVTTGGPEKPQDPGGLTWRTANLTNFESYPDPGSDECINFNGCKWSGYFAFVSGKQPESWVMANNIAAVHSKDSGAYKLKTLRLRQGTKTIDVKVYDMCSDSDCNGCCTQNANRGGHNFLIDVEKYTMQRFKTGSGVVEWACLDCN